MLVFYVFAVLSATVAALTGLMAWAVLVGIHALSTVNQAGASPSPALTSAVIASVILGSFIIHLFALQRMRIRLRRSFATQVAGLIQPRSIWGLLTTGLVVLLAFRRLRR